MNVWKPIAIASAAGLIASIGIQTASANKNPEPNPNLAGPCHDQPNMAAALGSLNSALGSLNRAEHDKGGWREQAVTATTNAITATNTGCSVANGK